MGGGAGVERILRVGLAGTGTMGQNHMRVIGARTDARLVAVSDPHPPALEDAVGHSGAQGFADPVAMLDEGNLDALVIATPTTAHARLALEALDRDIPVLIEKPIAANVEEGEEIVSR